MAFGNAVVNPSPSQYTLPDLYQHRTRPRFTKFRAESDVEKALARRKPSNDHLSPGMYNIENCLAKLSHIRRQLVYTQSKGKRKNDIDQAVKLAKLVPGAGHYQTDRAERKVSRPMRKY